MKNLLLTAVTDSNVRWNCLRAIAWKVHFLETCDRFCIANVIFLADRGHLSTKNSLNAWYGASGLALLADFEYSKFAVCQFQFDLRL